jgi:putative spermidine/putrescine transport system substrate-binding protein
LAVALAAVLAPIAGGVGKADSPSGNLVVWGFGGTFDAAMQTAVIEPFQKLYPNIKVRIAPGANSGAHLTKLLANKGRQDVDIDLIGGGLWSQAISNGVYEQIDPKLVPNLKYVYPQALGPKGYGPSIAFSGVGLAYNMDRIPTPPRSWKDLSKPAYRGHVGIPNLDNNAGLMLLTRLAVMYGGSAKKIEPGWNAIKRIKQAVNPIFFTSAADQQNQLANGNMWIAPMFDSQAHLLQKSGLRIGFVYPKEGGFVTHNMINIVKGTRYPEAAHAFINYFLNAYTQNRWSAAVRYGPTVKNTKLPAGVREEVIYGPNEVKRMFYANWAVINANRAAWIDRWNREVLS